MSRLQELAIGMSKAIQPSAAMLTTDADDQRVARFEEQERQERQKRLPLLSDAQDAIRLDNPGVFETGGNLPSHVSCFNVLRIEGYVDHWTDDDHEAHLREFDRLRLDNETLLD